MRNVIFVMLTLCGLMSVKAQALDLFFKEANVFLSEYVSNGKVNYEAIKKDKSSLDAVLKIANQVNITKEEPKKYQAFWINAYNLSVINGLVNNYPTNSPLDHDGFFDKTEQHIAGKKITLNDIEHKLLRAQFKDPRFHFVLVCGAIGCPPLIANAYLPSTLDAQLETQTKMAINGAFLKVNTKKKRVQASQIMEWYKEDFTMNNTSEIDFINTYRTEKLSNKFKLSYFPYNWKINKQ